MWVWGRGSYNFIARAKLPSYSITSTFNPIYKSFLRKFNLNSEKKFSSSKLDFIKSALLTNSSSSKAVEIARRLPKSK